MDDDEKTITDTIFKCAEDVEQEGYDDFYDWANVIFSCAEWKLEEKFDEDIIDNLDGKGNDAAKNDEDIYRMADEMRMV